MSDEALALAFEDCEATIRRHDYDRWLTSLYAHVQDRKALYALYAFNYEIAKTREAVSEPMVGEIRLQWWREAIEGLYEGKVRKHPVVQALAGVINDRSLEKAAFDRLIDARGKDLYGEQAADMDALLRYADDTGGAVCALAGRICGVQEKAADEAAIAVGRAWALVGLLRALGFQASMRRTPLPDDALKQAGISKESIFRGEFSDALRPLVKRIEQKAEDALEKARADRHMVPKRARNALLVGVLADNYLARLKQAGHDPFTADFTGGAAARQLQVFWSALRNRF